MKAHTAIATAVVCLLGAGCAQDGSLITGPLNTSSIEQKKAAEQAERTNAECTALVSQIETLNRDGTAAKVTKAANKKYKMKTTDLAKADELNKANAEFQTKCSNYPPPTVAGATDTPSAGGGATAAANPTPAPAASGTQVAKAKPPVPAPKPVASALAPQGAETFGQTATTTSQP